MAAGFGDYIRRRRRELGLTLMEVSARIGHSHAYLRDVEVGRRRPFKPNVLPLLACALECDLEELKNLRAASGETVEIPLSSKAGPAALALYRRKDDLTDEELEKILSILS